VVLSYPSADARPKFLGLDVLRGCAALAVVFFHANGVLNVPWLMPSGSMAVDLFFTMSGFVIAYAYDKKIPALGISGFIRLRAIRFYPLYLLGLGFGVLRAMILLRLGAQEQTYSGVVIALIAALAFFPAPALSAHDGISPLNGPAWSLILEMWINAAYALFFRYFTTRVLLLIVITSAILLTMYASAGQISGGPHWDDVLAGIARVCYSFPLGFYFIDIATRCRICTALVLL
jgi:peptidoglycan/LPS O-acetylase OafA/YrhL